MTDFTPDGYVVVAFDNGTVRTWKLMLQKAHRKSIHGAGPFDLSDIGYLQFDMHDTFEMVRGKAKNLRSDAHFPSTGAD